jgi:hypothetical protein
MDSPGSRALTHASGAPFACMHLGPSPPDALPGSAFSQARAVLSASTALRMYVFSQESSVALRRFM